MMESDWSVFRVYIIEIIFYYKLIMENYCIFCYLNKDVFNI